MKCENCRHDGVKYDFSSYNTLKHIRLCVQCFHQLRVFHHPERLIKIELEDRIVANGFNATTKPCCCAYGCICDGDEPCQCLVECVCVEGEDYVR